MEYWILPRTEAQKPKIEIKLPPGEAEKNWTETDVQVLFYTNLGSDLCGLLRCLSRMLRSKMGVSGKRRLEVGNWQRGDRRSDDDTGSCF